MCKWNLRRERMDQESIWDNISQQFSKSDKYKQPYIREYQGTLSGIYVYIYTYTYTHAHEAHTNSNSYFFLRKTKGRILKQFFKGLKANNYRLTIQFIMKISLYVQAK